ncbi:hypothetical protein BMG03_11040 [Thioclava nitratireducens]|uniref:Hedgehog/Intein (Hint) domain-containing protein n=1 Tax=Thioclava nitratireducens TaxID=1915078 RepID=A0ABM6IHZ5_9RHOB|nr:MULTISPECIES: Hint domain-containing protein [Thioclava]AQS48273.1 hypothetical protein BMG03_11040 [Thioclava nitratireducens]OWY04990.1 hypothetical protein B6V75_02300 [Thioclava sp. F1Mire-8]
MTRSMRATDIAEILAQSPAQGLRCTAMARTESLRLEFDSHDETDGHISGFDASGDTVFSGSIAAFRAAIPCVTPETRVATEAGGVPAGDLRPGARLVTRESGVQTLRWIGSRVFTAADLALNPLLSPVRIRAGALGEGHPVQDMRVSPNHRLMSPLRGNLVSAQELVGLDGVEAERAAGGVRYLQLLLDAPEMLLCDGLWVESFRPELAMLAGFDAAQRAELLALRPDLSRRDAEAALPETHPTE